MARVAVLILCGAILLAVWHSRDAEADHNTFLPLVPDTPLMQSIQATQTVKWCVNATGESYPNFVNQINDVQGEYTKRVGIVFQRVSWGSMAATGCQVQHNLTEFSCNGCAAHIFYANWPVVIEYKLNLGYTDWRSAQGHELGHGLLGLHEQYKDSGGVIQCTYRDDTVMSCGSPFVKYPQPRDVNLGCSILFTSWCGAQTAPDCGGPTADWGNGVTAAYNSCDGIWYASNGYTYSPSSNWWGFRDVGFSPCDSFGLRQIPQLGVTMPGLHSIFPWAYGYWITVPGC